MKNKDYIPDSELDEWVYGKYLKWCKDIQDQSDITYQEFKDLNKNNINLFEKTRLRKLYSEFIKQDNLNTFGEYLERMGSKSIFRFNVLYICVMAIMLVFMYFVRPQIVSGTSMYSTLHDKDILLTLKVNDVERGDIVTAESPDGINIVKRIIGLPGETVSIKDSKYYINGKVLDEPYIKERDIDEDYENRTWEIPEGYYFLSGDNRHFKKSYDSREMGPLPKERLKRKVWKIILPLGEILNK